MDTLYLSFSVVFPLLCMMSLGYSLTALKMFDLPFLKKINSFCFEVLLPILIFINIYQSNFNLSASLYLILFSLACVFVIFLLLLFFVPKNAVDRRDSGVIIQGIFRSNYVLFGIPIADSLYGSAGVQLVVLLISFVIPLYNVFAVLVLQGYSGKKTSLGETLKAMAKNPLILSSAIGFLFIGLRIELPEVMVATLVDISQIVTPLALIALGGSFTITGIKKYKHDLFISVMGKLVLIPLVFIPISILFGYRGLELTALMAMFVSPTAIASYTMAQNMGANDELAGQIVVLTSTLSIVTIFIWVSILQYIQLI